MVKCNVVALTLSLCTLMYVKYCICKGPGAKNVYNAKYISNTTQAYPNANGLNYREILATTPEIVELYGYPVESHTVTTEDGYLLTVHRIPGSPKASSSGAKLPVLIVHGVITSGESFVVLGPEKSLGFLLADQGYDVWLINHRGNAYSSKHVTISSKDPKFWNFTWHEMGVYDLPAVIDHILKVTDQPQLFCVAHSMGANVVLVLASEKPEYNQKFRLMVLMGPTIYTRPVRSALMEIIATNLIPLQSTIRRLGISQIPGYPKTLKMLFGRICREKSPLLEFCKLYVDSLFGKNPESFDVSKAPTVFSHLTSGTSMQVLTHFAENYVTDRFQKFDPPFKLGTIKPEYDLSKVSAPVSIYFSDKDVLVHPKNIMRLQRKLPNVVRMYQVPQELFTHVDFVFSKDVKHFVNDQLIEEFEKYG